MRILSGTEKNSLTVKDSVSGGELEVYYRTPTARERAGFQAESLSRKGKKVKLNLYAAREKYGLLILIGIREGDFGRPGPGGSPIPISSEPGNPNYMEGWKNLIKELAGDVVQTLAQVVFEGVRVEGADFDLDIGDDDDVSTEGLPAPAVNNGGVEPEGEKPDPLGQEH